MKKLIFIFLLLSASYSWAACPLYTYPENRKLDQEVNNLCDQIVNPPVIKNETVTNLTSSTATITNLISSTATIANLVGTISASNASSGSIGEYIESIVLSGSAVAQNGNETFTNVTSITLTAGDWDIFGCASITKGSAPTNVTKAAISAFSGNTTTDQNSGDNDFIGPIPATNADTEICVDWRRTISSSTIYYLKFKGDGGATMTGYGKLRAIRIR